MDSPNSNLFREYFFTARWTYDPQAQLVKNEFNPAYKATVACDFSMKILQLEDIEIRLQLWDLVGQDSRVGGINKLFCRGASGAMVLADITN